MSLTRYPASGTLNIWRTEIFWLCSLVLKLFSHTIALLRFEVLWLVYGWIYTFISLQTLFLATSGHSSLFLLLFPLFYPFKIGPLIFNLFFFFSRISPLFTLVIFSPQETSTCISSHPGGGILFKKI
jgi:hypothetical protein